MFGVCIIKYNFLKLTGNLHKRYNGVIKLKLTFELYFFLNWIMKNIWIVSLRTEGNMRDILIFI